MVQYEFEAQYISITEGDSTFKQIAFIDIDNNRTLQINRLRKRGFEIVRKDLTNCFNNKYIFKILQQYQAKGWELKSHNFGVGSSETDNNQVSFYLFTK
jgi:hypothetical protein